MKPPKSILDKSFVYRNAAQTDVRKTWERFGYAAPQGIAKEVSQPQEISAAIQPLAEAPAAQDRPAVAAPLRIIARIK